MSLDKGFLGVKNETRVQRHATSLWAVPVLDNDGDGDAGGYVVSVQLDILDVDNNTT